MPSRFDRYRMKDGATPLAERYFNPVWQDIDVRISGLESIRLSWEEAVGAVADFGLARINTVLGPLVADLDAASVAAEDKRQAALSAIDRLNAAIAGVPALSINIDRIDGRLDQLDESVADLDGALSTKADAQDTTTALAGKVAQTDFDTLANGLPRRILPDVQGKFDMAVGAKADQLAVIDGFGLYVYDAASTETPDGETVIEPVSGNGRWLLVAPSWDFVWAALAGLLDDPNLGNRMRSGSASLDFPAIAAGSSATLTIAVDGADTADRVLLTTPSTLPNGLLPTAWVSSSGTVTVQLTNVTGAAIDPAAMTYLVTTLRP